MPPAFLRKNLALELHGFGERSERRVNLAAGPERITQTCQEGHLLQRKILLISQLQQESLPWFEASHGVVQTLPILLRLRQNLGTLVFGRHRDCRVVNRDSFFLSGAKLPTLSGRQRGIRHRRRD